MRPDYEFLESVRVAKDKAEYEKIAIPKRDIVLGKKESKSQVICHRCGKTFNKSQCFFISNSKVWACEGCNKL